MRMALLLLLLVALMVTSLISADPPARSCRGDCADQFISCMHSCVPGSTIGEFCEGFCVVHLEICHVACGPI